MAKFTWSKTVQSTLLGSTGEYVITSRASVQVPAGGSVSIIHYHFGPGQFHIGALRALLVDSRQTYSDALKDHPGLPRLSNRMVLALSNMPAKSDMREMLADGNRFRIELVIARSRKSVM